MRTQDTKMHFKSLWLAVHGYIRLQMWQIQAIEFTFCILFGAQETTEGI